MYDFAEAFETVPTGTKEEAGWEVLCPWGKRPMVLRWIYKMAVKPVPEICPYWETFRLGHGPLWSLTGVAAAWDMNNLNTAETMVNILNKFTKGGDPRGLGG